MIYIIATICVVVLYTYDICYSIHVYFAFVLLSLLSHSRFCSFVDMSNRDVL